MIIVVVALTLLTAQGFYSFRVWPEPYPVIRMPAFAAASSAKGTLPVTFVKGSVDFSDGSSQEIDPLAVMETMRFSTARPTLDYAFGPTSAHQWSPQVHSWLRERVEAVTGRTDATEIRFCWQEALVHNDDARVSDQQPCEWTQVPL
ncbi:hypothetical protein MTES_2748 [Microbacterium testaceum StLB037]|uniref:Uncharacterized protein n=1 Tax=Microbacterium testaceum (strain StLB037) TaxID=979556 RepID=E8N8Q6_MICTS|nr:hypothetical protein [Microbacterium testaceum]BAJ75712.1 hypothetical protein MTES_2748 [Microbacterium testaceum StLB037]